MYDSFFIKLDNCGSGPCYTLHGGLLKYTLTVPFLYTHMLISSMKTDESKPDEKKKVAIKKLIFHLLSSKWLFTVSFVPTIDSCYNCASFTRYKINIITTQSQIQDKYHNHTILDRTTEVQQIPFSKNVFLRIQLFLLKALKLCLYLSMVNGPTINRVCIQLIYIQVNELILGAVNELQRTDIYTLMNYNEQIFTG